MDKNYIITSNGGFVSEDELSHHGTRGMKWGLRRYQNADGSLTAEGRKRYGYGEGRDTRGGDRSASDDTNSRKSRGIGSDDSGRSERANKREAIRAEKAEEKIKQQEEKRAEEKTSDDESDGNKTKLDGKSLDEISDKNLRARLDRMRNENAYDQMMVERGYVQVEKYSDMDRKISELKKQKEYSDLLVGLDTQTQISELTRQKELKTLQRDIKSLDKELNAKEKSKMKQVGERVLNEVVVDSAVTAGKQVLTQWLINKGMKAITKNDAAVDAADAVLDKTGEKLGDKAKKVTDLTAQEMAKQSAKQAAKEAKAAAKAEAKAAKRAAKEAAKEAESDDKVYEGEVLSKTKRSDSSSGDSDSSRKNVIYADYEDVTNNKKSSTIALGERTVSGYLDSGSSNSTLALGQKTVSGYLTTPTSSTSSSTTALGERTVAGLLSAPANSRKTKFTGSITRNASGTTARIKSMKATGNYTNAEIADKLGISESTLNNYLYGGDN